MKTYIIHYTKLKERKDNILSLLSNTNLDYEFILEYDKEYLDGNSYYIADKIKFDEKIKDLWDERIHKFRVLNDAEISCTIKHILAIEKIANQNDDVGLIFEDDVLPIENNFAAQIEHLIEVAPNNWDAIFMGVGCGIDFMNQKLVNSHIINEKFAQVNHPTTNCAEAYLLRKEAAKRIYESIIPFQLVSDWELAYQFYKLNMNVYWSIPPLFYQGSKSGQYNSTLR
ncbi:MAG: glycosyltransferase family 25 protein [Methanobacterium sp.]